MKIDNMYKEKIAVFDLDDTLYKANSHIEILCEYYKTNFFKSLLFKLIGKIFSQVERKLLYYFYNKIPQEVKENYLLDFNLEVVKLLKDKQEENYYILIISNAPIELLTAAAHHLKVEYLEALPYRKAEALNRNYTYNYLFVCTDNKSDIDLLEIADKAVITCSKKSRNYFKKNLSRQNYTFLVNDNV